ncbi:unnamed protein product [Caenorhabditis brenneri]
MPRIEAVSIVVRESCGYMSKEIALIVRGHIRDHRKMSQRRAIDQYQYGFGRKTEESSGHKDNTSCQGFHQDASTTSGVSEVARHLQSTHSSSSTKQSFGRCQDKEQSCPIKTRYRKMKSGRQSQLKYVQHSLTGEAKHRQQIAKNLVDWSHSLGVSVVSRRRLSSRRSSKGFHRTWFNIGHHHSVKYANGH